MSQDIVVAWQAESWDPTDRVYGVLISDCLADNEKFQAYVKDGSYVLPKGSLTLDTRSTTPTDRCEVTLRLELEVTGTADEAFFDGETTAKQVRTLHFDSVP